MAMRRERSQFFGDFGDVFTEMVEIGNVIQGS